MAEKNNIMEFIIPAVSADSGRQLGVVLKGSLGDDIKKARLKWGYTQKELAEKLSISPAELCRLEKGGSSIRPSRGFLKRLSPYVGESYTFLLLKSGYSGVHEKEEFFTTTGIPIDPSLIAIEIYKEDPDLLYLFQDIHRFSTQININLLKLLLQAMKEEEISPEQVKSDNNASHLKESFHSLKIFLVDYLKPAKARR